MPLRHDRGRRRRHRAGRDRRRGRRRGPRERGRPHHGGRVRHAREDRVLPPPHLGRHLRADHRRAGSTSSTSPLMVRAQHREPAHRVHRQRRLPPRHHHRHLRRRPRRHHPGARRPGHPARRPGPPRPHLPAAATARAACSSGPATPRPPSTWPAWPACYPAGVLCEIVNEDEDDMARAARAGARSADEHGLLLISIADLIRYRRQNEKLVRRVAEARIPTEWGDFTCYVYESVLDGEQHVAFVRGAVQGEDERARAGAQRVPHRRRVRLAALRLRRRSSTRPCSAIAERGPRRASSTCAATRAGASASATRSGPTSCRTQGHDTVDANLELGLPVDSREYGIGAQILVDLGITTMRLHDQQPGQVRRPRGLRPRDRRAGAARDRRRTPRTSRYLRTKRERMGHLLDGLDDVDGRRSAPWRGGRDARPRSRRARARRRRPAGRRRAAAASTTRSPSGCSTASRRGPRRAAASPTTTSPRSWVPGAFEIPLAAKALAESGAVDAVICLGA